MLLDLIKAYQMTQYVHSFKNIDHFAGFNSHLIYNLCMSSWMFKFVEKQNL